MKKVLLLLSLLSMSCNADFSEVNPVSPDACEAITTAKHVSETDIECFLTNYKEIPQTRAGEISVEPILYQNDTVMFLINYGEGWDVISADKRAPMVLMQSDTGHTTIEALYDNPGKQIKMETMASTILALRSNPEAKFSLRSAPAHSENATRTPAETPQTDTYVSMWDVVAPENIIEPAAAPVGPPAFWTCIGVEKISSESAEQPHLMQTKWDQGAPWNYYSPYTSSAKIEQCYTGCGPVAAAQVLYYLRTKKNIPIKTYTEVSARNTFIPDNMTYMYLSPYNITINTSSHNSWTWYDMATTGHLSDNGSIATNYVSALMIYLGYRLKAEYTKNDGTSSYPSDIPSVFSTYFGINCTFVNNKFNWGIARNYIITKKLPIIVLAKSLGGNHIFVVDGYKYKTEVYKYTYIKSNTPTPEYKYENKWIYEDFIQINWGYSGKAHDVWYTDTNDWEVSNSVYYETLSYVYGFTAK